MSENYISKMKVADLKRELKVRGLPITGNKNELQERLQAAMIGDGSLDESTIGGDDLLDDGVLSDEDDDAKAIHTDEEILKSPTPPTTTDDSDKSVPGTVTKKISLKRQSSVLLQSDATEKSKENTEPEPPKVLKMSERHPISVETLQSNNSETESTASPSPIKKLSQLTLEERLAIRAKKFGLTETEQNKKSHITSQNTPIDTSLLSSISEEKQLELLKKRAERFGCVTSSQIAKLDEKERLIKRKERFTDGLSSSKKSEDEDDVTWKDKARKRLERFTITSDATNANAPKKEIENLS